MRQSSSHLDPGNGADRPERSPAPLRYIYVARSRRSGGLSLGVDLTPQGHCSFSCIYCQAKHPVVLHPDLRVDLALLEAELRAQLTSDVAPQLRDLVLAGSGEPTAPPNFDAAIDTILGICTQTQFNRPVRIFTNARHLDSVEVQRALAQWNAAKGEVWVKLDGATPSTIERVNARIFDVERHLAGIFALALRQPIGIQTMLFRGPNVPAAQQVVDEVGSVLERAIADGAQLREVHLVTLSRMPSDEGQAKVLSPIASEELEALAVALQARVGIAVRFFAAA